MIGETVPIRLERQTCSFLCYHFILWKIHSYLLKNHSLGQQHYLLLFDVEDFFGEQICFSCALPTAAGSRFASAVLSQQMGSSSWSWSGLTALPLDVFGQGSIQCWQETDCFLCLLLALFCLLSKNREVVLFSPSTNSVSPAKTLVQVCAFLCRSKEL